MGALDVFCNLLVVGATQYLLVLVDVGRTVHCELLLPHSRSSSWMYSQYLPWSRCLVARSRGVQLRDWRNFFVDPGDIFCLSVSLWQWPCVVYLHMAWRTGYWWFLAKFAICCRPSVCLSSVCNARSPYSGGWNFRQYFYGIRYLGHPLTSTENCTEIVPGEPLRRGS